MACMNASYENIYTNPFSQLAYTYTSESKLFHRRAHPFLREIFYARGERTAPSDISICGYNTTTRSSRTRLSPLHTDLQSEGLPQETLSRLHGTLLLHLKLKETEDRTADNQEFHLRDVATDTGSGAGAEGNESGLLTRGEAGGVPALRDELLGIGAPDLGGAVDGVAGHGDNVAGVEGVAGDGDGGVTGGDFTGETHSGGAVDAHGFPDNPLEVGDVLDHRVRGDVDVLRDGFVQDLVELLDHTGRAHAPVEDGAGGVGGGIGSGDQLGQSFGGKFGATEFFAVAILAFHEAGEQVDTGVVGHDFGAETLVDTGDGNTSQVLDGLDTITEETVGDVLGKGLQGRVAAQGGGDFTAAVEDLDGLDVGGGRVGSLAHLGEILALVEHAEGSAEGQVTDDVESQVVEPVQGVQTGETGLGVALGIGHAVPLLDEQLDVAVNVLLELADGLHTEGVGDGLALAGVLRAVARVEETTVNGDEGIVEVTGTRVD